MNVFAGGGGEPPPGPSLTETASLLTGSLNLINNNEQMELVIPTESNKRPAEDNLLQPRPKGPLIPQPPRPQPPTPQPPTPQPPIPQPPIPEPPIPQPPKITNSNISAPNKFKITSSGPFFVFVEHEEKRRLHPMQIGKLLFSDSMRNQDAIINVNAIGYSKVKIEVKSAIKANTLVEDDIFKKHNMKAYIPNFLMYKHGVIQNVDTTLSEEEILEYIKSEVKVLGIRRLNKRVKEENKVTWKPSYSCSIKFEGELPRYVSILGTRCEVNPYIPKVVQCYKCLRYGHVKSQCKSTTDRCSNCGQDHERKNCDEEKNAPKCVHCKGEHSSMYRGCEEYKKMERVRATMTINNLTFSEAKKILYNTSSYASVVSATDKAENSKNQQKHIRFSQVQKPKTNYAQPSTSCLPPADLFYPALNQHSGPINNPYRPLNYSINSVKECLQTAFTKVIPHLLQKFQENQQWFKEKKEVDELEILISRSVENYYKKTPNHG